MFRLEMAQAKVHIHIRGIHQRQVNTNEYKIFYLASNHSGPIQTSVHKYTQCNSSRPRQNPAAAGPHRRPGPGQQ